MSFYIIFAFLALLIGSFLNVVIYRLPLILQSNFVIECSSLLNINNQKPDRFNLWMPRSHCTNCNYTIPFWHNIPLFSFLLLQGKCSNCTNPISWRYPAVEILCSFLSLYSVIHFGFKIELIFPLLFVWIVLSLFFIDLKHHLLPDSLTLSLLWIGLVANINNLYTTVPNAVLSTIGAYLILTLIINLFNILTGKIGMGKGDIKLFAAFGSWFGWEVLPQLLFIASMLGSAIGILYLYKTKQNKNTPIAFGPFLIIAAVFTLFTKY